MAEPPKKTALKADRDKQEPTVTQQAKRYLTLVGIFAFSGWLVWLGDEWRISTVPAHYVGYLIAAVGVAGLLGLNIWSGGPLDKRKDAEFSNKN
jgi:hypothetical protein